VEIPAGAARIREQAGNWEFWEIQPQRGVTACAAPYSCSAPDFQVRSIPQHYPDPGVQFCEIALCCIVEEQADRDYAQTNV
jgi:hypothetical protein